MGNQVPGKLQVGKHLFCSPLLFSVYIGCLALMWHMPLCNCHLHLLGTVSLLFPHWIHQARSLHFQDFCLYLPFPCRRPECWGFELISSCLCGKHFGLRSYLSSLSSLSASDSACRLALVHPAPDNISIFLCGFPS